MEYLLFPLKILKTVLVQTATTHKSGLKHTIETVLALLLKLMSTFLFPFYEEQQINRPSTLVALQMAANIMSSIVDEYRWFLTCNF